jgi:hypothetical protein
MGVGSEQGNLDQNDQTKELVWQGPINPNSKFYVRLVNEGTSTITYCLLTRPDKSTCPP